MKSQIPYIVAKAGAGTGKTYALVENYVDAIFGLDGSKTKKRPQEILALTFTDKAAQEMRLRIISKISSYLSDKQAKIHLDNRCIENEITPLSQDEIKRILRALPRAPIQTFHGFCSSIMSRESSAIGIHEFQIMSPKEENFYAKNILRPIILKHINKHDPVVRSLVARFRLSSGKISLGIIDSILSLYLRIPEQGLEIHDLYQTRPSINQEKFYSVIKNIENIIDQFYTQKISVVTKNRFDYLKELLKSCENFIFGLDEDDDAKIFIKLREAVKGNFGGKEMRHQLVSEIVILGALLADFYLDKDEKILFLILSEFHKSFEDFKKISSLYGYSDLLLKMKSFLKEDKTFRNRIKKSITHILVDEYQDTSPIQEDIIALLLHNEQLEISKTSGKRLIDNVLFSGAPSLFVVGDKKQSIYGFRGADVSLFDNLEEKISKHCIDGFEKRLLTINRRSNSSIIKLVNLVSRTTLGLQGYDTTQDLECFNHDEMGRCALWIKENKNQDKTQTNLMGAAIGVIELIRARPDIKAKDIVVLTRRIKSAGVIKNRLAKGGVKSHIIGGDSFFQQQEIVDILSALKLINDTNHQIASAVVLRSPLVLLSDQDMLAIKQMTGAITFNAACLDVVHQAIDKNRAERVTQFAKALVEIRSSIKQVGLACVIDILIDRCNLAYTVGIGDNPDQAWANIKKLRVLLLTNKKDPFAFIDELYDRIKEDLREPLAEYVGDDDAVTIMTIHQSKGLEFDVVVLADTESMAPMFYGDIVANKTWGLAVRPRGRMIARCVPTGSDKQIAQIKYDHIKDDAMHKEQQELARLLYVALTRAKKELYVVCSKDSFLNEKKSLSLMGEFLKAYRNNKNEFLSCCDVVEINDSDQTVPDDPIKISAPKEIIFELPAKVKRVFASDLCLADEELLKPLIKKHFTSSKNFIDGSLAHQLIAAVGRPFLSGSSSEIDEMMDAVLRMQGLNCSKETHDTAAAVKVTLMQLGNFLNKSGNVIFEMPLSCRPHVNLVVEGFADMVVHAAHAIFVFEFKSTFNSAKAAQSYAQVMAYAHALGEHFKKPVQFAVVLFGDESAINCCHYDDNIKAIFLKSLENY